MSMFDQAVQVSMKHSRSNDQVSKFRMCIRCESGQGNSGRDRSDLVTRLSWHKPSRISKNPVKDERRGAIIIGVMCGTPQRNQNQRVTQHK